MREFQTSMRTVGSRVPLVLLLTAVFGLALLNAGCGSASKLSSPTAPTVSIMTPANGATVSGTITVTATATDNVAVASVQF